MQQLELDARVPLIVGSVGATGARKHPTGGGCDPIGGVS